MPHNFAPASSSRWTIELGHRDKLDSYLDIAEIILREVKRPLSPRAILDQAYRAHLVPNHLHGRTQHKTLQARLSEDIVARRDESPFYRTSPGIFFLREFMSDPTLPDEYRTPYIARRRTRELVNGPALTVSRAAMERLGTENSTVDKNNVLNLLNDHQFSYELPKDRTSDHVFVWSYVVVCRESAVLSYRLGRYRDDRDYFRFKRTIGFSTLVDRDKVTLFNYQDFGIVECGVSATKTDLDFPRRLNSEEPSGEARLGSFLWMSQEGGMSDLVAVIYFECPKWFEPLKRRLAINDLQWLSGDMIPNDFDDFEPWSRHLLRERSLLLAENRYI